MVCRSGQCAQAGAGLARPKTATGLLLMKKPCYSIGILTAFPGDRWQICRNSEAPA